MSTLDEVNRMQSTGMSEQQIVSGLRGRGVSDQEIGEAISQAKIKQAVSSGPQDFTPQQDFSGAPPGFAEPMPPEQFGQGQFNFTPQPPGPEYAPPQNQYGFAPQSNQYLASGTGEYSGMEPSMVTQDQYYPSPGAGGGQDYAAVGGYSTPQTGQYQEQYGAGQGQYSEGGAYSMYQPYQEALNSDVITEISEQIVDERLSVLHDKIEKILDMRTVVEANMTNLHDRLKRMESIVDQMQISLLKKVGEYLTDVQDVKQELAETQKSFVAIAKKDMKVKKR